MIGPWRQAGDPRFDGEAPPSAGAVAHRLSRPVTGVPEESIEAASERLQLLWGIWRYSAKSRWDANQAVLHCRGEIARGPEAKRTAAFRAIEAELPALLDRRVDRLSRLEQWEADVEAEALHQGQALELAGVDAGRRPFMYLPAAGRRGNDQCGGCGGRHDPGLCVVAKTTRFDPAPHVWQEPQIRRQTVSKFVKAWVYDRDGHRCRYCGSAGSSQPRNPLSLDHVWPVSAGAGNDVWELVVACLRCNMAKGDKAPTVALGQSPPLLGPSWTELRTAAAAKRRRAPRPKP